LLTANSCKLRSPEFVLTHSPRPAVRYRPLPTCFLCQVSCETPQSAIFNQLALKLGLRAHHQPGKSVNASGLLFWPRTSPVLLNQRFAIDPCRPSRRFQLLPSSNWRRFQHLRVQLGCATVTQLGSRYSPPTGKTFEDVKERV
jgi:hypothetical protein